MTDEDVAYLDACNDLPMGRWDATIGAELAGDYQKMYQIAETQRAVYEKRMQALASMPVSDRFEGIKEEYCLADECGLLACEYEMKRARTLMESNLTGEKYYWGLGDRAMDESLNHLALAKKAYGEQYGSEGLLDGIVSAFLS
ncbi:hypothetical protein RJ40_05335 [Methanofollis aquaemaris]|uniref:Uncharacterized protein n=1 Tax=Methanofollis aquaemaris TaxID=126734 RepID=A0A8A3S5Q7_9EURY|nr:hypothetical protein [Methanofollis aquaemaris]QSZ66956.1 hypothetical protein RJ40_05335 [Methanofollis aquaemaris]